MTKYKVIILAVILTALILGFFAIRNLNSVKVPALTELSLSEGRSWSNEQDIELKIASDYNDDTVPNQIYFQSVSKGTRINKGTTIEILYSKGYNPETTVSLPNLKELTEEEISDIFESLNIKNYTLQFLYSESITEGDFISLEINKNEVREENKRKDDYVINMSLGKVNLDELNLGEQFDIRGVNLGGWFVLEGWMTPSLFEGVNGTDETIFVETKYNSKELLEEHWATFITEEDFKWLSERGINSVRIPIPWWLWGDTPYHNSVKYIEQALEWGEK